MTLQHGIQLEVYQKLHEDSLDPIQSCSCLSVRSKWFYILQSVLPSLFANQSPPAAFLQGPARAWQKLHKQSDHCDLGTFSMCQRQQLYSQYPFSPTTTSLVLQNIMHLMKCERDLQDILRNAGAFPWGPSQPPECPPPQYPLLKKAPKSHGWNGTTNWIGKTDITIINILGNDCNSMCSLFPLHNSKCVFSMIWPTTATLIQHDHYDGKSLGGRFVSARSTVVNMTRLRFRALTLNAFSFNLVLNANDFHVLHTSTTLWCSCYMQIN